jgi:conjugal transfer pilus assembly protein TraW
MKDLEKYWRVVITIIAIIFVLGTILLLLHVEQANAGDLYSSSTVNNNDNSSKLDQPKKGSFRVKRNRRKSSEQKDQDKIQDQRLIIDHGKQAHTFKVKERSLLEYIKEQLEKANNAGKIKELQQEYTKKAKDKILKPTPVPGITNTTNSRIFYFDTTYRQKEDIKDHKGNILIKAGTTVNPLDHLSWGKPLLFIDGTSKEQLNWAMAQEGKITLVKGAPIDLYKQYNRWFYFDQGGLITSRFGITGVPARISQAGKKLKIEEVKL